MARQYFHGERDHVCQLAGIVYEELQVRRSFSCLPVGANTAHKENGQSSKVTDRTLRE